MSRKSAYVGWFGRLNLPKIDDTEKEEFCIEDLEYSNERLSFKIVRYITRKVAVRYTTVDYQKYPVEWKDSVRSAVIYKVDKMINIERYCEIELPKIDIPDDFKLEILEELEYTPSWRQKEIDLENVNKLTEELEKQIDKLVDVEHALKVLNNKYQVEINESIILLNNVKTQKSSTISLILRIIFSIPTLFLSWIGYVSEKQSIRNIERYHELEGEIKTAELNRAKDLEKLKIELENKNVKISNSNAKINELIDLSKKKVEKISNSDYTKVLGDDGFIDLRKAIVCITKFDCKGVYIIWNKTKNKYYVGQSKNVYARLFMQHFKNGDVGNVLFAKDWYNGDEFFYKIKPLQTKDELDNIERKYIDKYDSFRSGYNNTSGNK